MAYKGPAPHRAIVCQATPQTCLTLLAGLDFQRLQGTQNALSSTGTPGRGAPSSYSEPEGQFRALYNSTCQGWVLHRSEEQAAEKAVKLGRQLLEPTKELLRSSEPRNPRSSMWGDVVWISKEIYLLLFIARDTVPKVAPLEKHLLITT